ncbi:hypothetical protein SAMN05444267_10105 [Chryseobacterium polytrichastri]|uniref:Uncharacterized protein n=1 Tax=Chryseobacterium polytrichastri TaxID=1302687 RepID=A0A1M6WUY3_9FLAO|nr:hypothetical protein SAMN05444267_10105 [Chryseobacterium polytrichastri]
MVNKKIKSELIQQFRFIFKTKYTTWYIFVSLQHNFITGNVKSRKDKTIYY